jgi:hypothetical protein
VPVLATILESKKASYTTTQLCHVRKRFLVACEEFTCRFVAVRGSELVMVKKGLSLEQKREKVLGIFNESDEVYQLKEIEKIAPGRGVVLQSVKEVVQSLVDDGLVHQVCNATIV